MAIFGADDRLADVVVVVEVSTAAATKSLDFDEDVDPARRSAALVRVAGTQDRVARLVASTVRSGIRRHSVAAVAVLAVGNAKDGVVEAFVCAALQAESARGNWLANWQHGVVEAPWVAVLIAVELCRGCVCRGDG